MTLGRSQWYVRGAAATVLALLLAGCGDEGGDRAPALDQGEINRVLPDAAALPGWETVTEPKTMALNDALREDCWGKGGKTCAGAAFYGEATFKRADPKAQVRFWLIGYQDEKSATAGYTGWRQKPALSAGPGKVELGDLGAEREAYKSSDNNGSSVSAQIRVGTAVVWAATDFTSEKDLDEKLAKDAAALITKRAQQAQDGQDPSAHL